MAGHRRHQKHLGLRLQRVFLEAQQRSERRAEHRHFAHRNLAVVHGYGRNAERRALVGHHGRRENLGRGGRQPADRRARHQLAAPPDIQPGPGAMPKRRQQIGLGLVKLVKHKPDG